MNQRLEELITRTRELQQLALESNQGFETHSYEDYACGELYHSLSTWLGRVVGEVDDTKYDNPNT